MFMSDRPTDMGKMNVGTQSGDYKRGNDARWYNVAGAGDGDGGGSNGSSGSGISDWYGQLMAAQQAARNAAYDQTIAQQKANYDYNAGQVQGAADKALQESYINKMMNEKNLRQNLSAQGLGGGASETTLGSLLNAYNGSRNNIETNRASNIASLMNTLQNNMANAAVTRDTGAAGDMTNYATNLATLAAYNPKILSSMQQGGNNSAITNYIKNLLANSQTSKDDIASYISSLG